MQLPEQLLEPSLAASRCGQAKLKTPEGFAGFASATLLSSALFFPSLLSVYLNFCNNLQQMRIVSVFGAARKREATPQQQAKFWGAILLLLFVLRLLLTLSTVFRPSLSLSFSPSLSECRRRCTNFTFAQISFINIPGEGLQIECLIAMKLHRISEAAYVSDICSKGKC